jgi:hypothetical protein
MSARVAVIPFIAKTSELEKTIFIDLMKPIRKNVDFILFQWSSSSPEDETICEEFKRCSLIDDYFCFIPTLELSEEKNHQIAQRFAFYMAHQLLDHLLQEPKKDLEIYYFHTQDATDFSKPILLLEEKNTNTVPMIAKPTKLNIAHQRHHHHHPNGQQQRQRQRQRQRQKQRQIEQRKKHLLLLHRRHRQQRAKK